MKKVLAVALFIFAFLVFPPNQAMAQSCSGNHGGHGIICPDTSWNLIGVSYNSVSENWEWYMGVKTTFFHPARYVWVGGLGLGLAFHQSEHAKNIPVLTFVPLKIGSFVAEVSLNKVSAVSPTGERKRARLAILSWNWRF